MHARFLLAPAAFAAAAIMLACSPGERQAERSAAAPAAVSAEAASDALAAFGLAEPGRVTWDSRTQDGARFTFDGVRIADPDGALTAARLVLDGPALTEEGPVFAGFELTDARVSETEGDLVAVFDRLFIGEAGPEVAEAVAAALQGREAFLDAADPAAGRFGEMRIDALSVTGTSETGQPLALTLESALASGHDGETLEQVRIEALRFETRDEMGAPVTVSLDRLAADGVASQLAGLAEAGAAPAAPLAGALTPNSQYDSFAISGLDVRASGVQVIMPSLSGVVEEAGGDRLISRTVMERLSLSADSGAGPQGAQLAQALDQLGYESLDFSLRNAVAYDLAADRVQTIEENYLRLEDGFTLSFEQVADGAGAYAEAYAAWLEREDAAPGETPPAEVFEPLMIERMVFALEDQSLLDRSLGVLAEMQGVTPEQLRVQAGAYVALGAAFAGEMVPPQLLGELQSALTGFIGQGGTLTVTLAPDEPVSMSEIMAEGSTPDAAKLGLSVSHDAP